MREKKTYICEICDSDHGSKLEAEMCERSHYMLTGIKSLTYNKRCPIPEKIEVLFGDKLLSYRFDDRLAEKYDGDYNKLLCRVDR